MGLPGAGTLSLRAVGVIMGVSGIKNENFS